MERVLGRFRLLAVAAVIALSLSAFAGTAAAATGACNMLHAWDVGANGGMANAMVRNNPAGDISSGNGNAGMWNAVLVSSGAPTCP